MVPDTEETLMYLIFRDTILYYLPSNLIIIDLNEDPFLKEKDIQIIYLFIWLFITALYSSDEESGGGGFGTLPMLSKPTLFKDNLC